MVAKLLFLSKRAQPDIQLTIAFLTTRVQNPEDGHLKKLRRVLNYLDIIIHSVKLYLKVNDLNAVHWWVDTSYGTHPDLKGETGPTISIRKGCVTSAQKKQKVNTTSSKIRKVVGVHEVSPQVLWTRAFLQEKGFEVNKATLYQDSMSAMLLKKRAHVKLKPNKTHHDQLLFIQYRIDKGGIGLEYCHTDKMVANFMTKPIQGR